MMAPNIARHLNLPGGELTVASVKILRNLVQHNVSVSMIALKPLYVQVARPCMLADEVRSGEPLTSQYVYLGQTNLEPLSLQARPSVHRPKRA